MQPSWYSAVSLLILVAVCAHAHPIGLPHTVPAEQVPVIVFNITVDETMWRPCVGWGVAPALEPSKKTLGNVMIQSCDSGPFIYSYNYNFNYPVLQPTFYSSVIVDASPPTCTITCKPVSDQKLPYQCTYCTVLDSREGYHLTKYKFDVVAWHWRS